MKKLLIAVVLFAALAVQAARDVVFVPSSHLGDYCGGTNLVVTNACKILGIAAASDGTNAVTIRIYDNNTATNSLVSV